MPETRSLKSRIQEGTCVYGMFIFSPDPAHTELAGLSGIDFVIVDLEHAPLEIGNVLDHVRAARGVGISVIVRVADDAPAGAARLLDAGVEGIIFPHVGLSSSRTKNAVSAMRYSPDGNRPACTGVRAADYGLRPFVNYVGDSNAGSFAIGLIEDTLAIDSLESVLETSGLDMVMPGPGDLAASLGLPGQLTHPRVAKEIARIVAIVKKRSNCYIAAYVNNAEEAISWRKSGAKLIAYSIDYKIFGAALRDIRQAMPD